MTSRRKKKVSAKTNMCNVDNFRDFMRSASASRFKLKLKNLNVIDKNFPSPFTMNCIVTGSKYDRVREFDRRTFFFESPSLFKDCECSLNVNPNFDTTFVRLHFTSSKRDIGSLLLELDHSTSPKGFPVEKQLELFDSKKKKVAKIDLEYTIPANDIEEVELLQNEKIGKGVFSQMHILDVGSLPVQPTLAAHNIQQLKQVFTQESLKFTTKYEDKIDVISVETHVGGEPNNYWITATIYYKFKKNNVSETNSNK